MAPQARAFKQAPGTRRHWTAGCGLCLCPLGSSQAGTPPCLHPLTCAQLWERLILTGKCPGSRQPTQRHTDRDCCSLQPLGAGAAAGGHPLSDHAVPTCPVCAAEGPRAGAGKVALGLDFAPMAVSSLCSRHCCGPWTGCCCEEAVGSPLFTRSLPLSPGTQPLVSFLVATTSGSL